MHDPTMRRLRRKLHAREHEQHDERTSKRKVTKARRAVAFLEHDIAKVQARRHGLDLESVLDGTPMPLGQKLVLLDARRNGWTGVATSGDRRTAIARLLKRLGKQDQEELYDGYKEGRAGYLPANPPDRGSHVRIGDGVVGELFAPLPWWREGIDATESTQLRAVVNGLGYSAERPYDTASEEHHTNLSVNPHRRLIERGLV